jgi:anti-sigma B factor antagonist
MTLVVRRHARLTPEIRSEADHAVVTLVGDLDASTAGLLYEQFAALTREGAMHVALDLEGLAFMDSTGLSVIIAEHKRTTSLGGELTIYSPQEPVRKLFEMTGLMELLDVLPKNRPH